MRLQPTMIAACAALMLAACSSPNSPAPSAVAEPAPAQSACTELGGEVDADHVCQVHDTTPTTTTDITFPVGYPDQAPVIDFVKQRRDDFRSDVATYPPRSFPYELKLQGKDYHSGAPKSGTASLVFDVYNDLLIHPTATFTAFNYDLGKRAPITIDTLFKPGAQPLDVLNPFVQREVAKREAGQPPIELELNDFRSFALTDDSVVFFLNQDMPIPHELGPLTITVPRSELASLLA